MDFGAVFGEEETGKHFIIGRPRDMEIPVTIDLARAGRAQQRHLRALRYRQEHPGPTAVLRPAQDRACVNLIFDMHSEYAYAKRMESGAFAKGLRELFGRSRVLVYSLEDAASGKLQQSTS